DEDCVENRNQALLLGLLENRGLYLLLEAGINVDYIPSACHLMSHPEDEPHPGRKHLINQEEEDRRDKYHSKNHCRRYHSFLSARPGHPRDLLANLLNKLGGTRLRHS